MIRRIKGLTAHCLSNRHISLLLPRQVELEVVLSQHVAVLNVARVLVHVVTTDDDAGVGWAPDGAQAVDPRQLCLMMLLLLLLLLEQRSAGRRSSRRVSVSVLFQMVDAVLEGPRRRIRRLVSRPVHAARRRRRRPFVQVLLPEPEHDEADEDRDEEEDEEDDDERDADRERVRRGRCAQHGRRAAPVDLAKENAVQHRRPGPVQGLNLPVHDEGRQASLEAWRTTK